MTAWNAVALRGLRFASAPQGDGARHKQT